MAFKINNKVLHKHFSHLVPHGINEKTFSPISSKDKRILEKRKVLFGEDASKYEFVLFYNSRNVQRKRTSNIILAFRAFCDGLSKEDADKCVLLLHTEKALDAGTDLIAVKEAVCPNYNVIIDETRWTPEDMAVIYNVADVTINISSNEGFGLSIAESIMSGTPIIVNVTGGLQDQIGQVDNEGKPLEFNTQFATNNGKTYENYGVWAYAVWPAARYIQGSIPTPYIFDDVCKWEDVAEGMMYWYLAGNEKRELAGSKGRFWAMGEGGINATNMCNQFITAMNLTLENFVPEAPYKLYVANKFLGHSQPENSIGVVIPKIDTEKLLKKLERIL